MGFYVVGCWWVRVGLSGYDRVEMARTWVLVIEMERVLGRV